MVRPGRLSGSLPLSIAVHVIALVLLVLFPLMADVTLPLPPMVMPPYMPAVVLAAPPPVRTETPASAPAPSPVSRNAAPVVAPREIGPETVPSAPSMPDLPAGDAPTGSGDLGAIIDGAARIMPSPPPPPQHPAGPIRVSELVQPPRKIVDVRPEYPALARQAKVDGTVILEAILDRSGRVDGLRVVKSIPLLDQAALEAVRQWRYTPTVLNGQPVAVLMTITIRFTLQQ